PAALCVVLAYTTLFRSLVFLRGLVQKSRWAKEIHIVLDNLSAHKTKAVEEFLQENPKVRFHFTPTYSSWLNQVELWFAKIQRDVDRKSTRLNSSHGSTS